MRIDNARSIHCPPTWEAPAGVRLRTRAVVALRQEAPAFEEHRRCLYEGVISRDQAARGAAIGQYVRMAIAHADERGISDATADVEITSAVLRHDLIGIMLRSMTGEDGEQERGRYVRDVV
ncbi:MAG: hypothetical protein NFCOHLIN_00094 [Gammaproteobacteria bacterium]|nr:hypothetical protein [Gammaproteobacteria bacterium]